MRLLVLLAAVLALALAGCGGDDDGGSGDGGLDSGVVAKVGDQEIEDDDLDRQVEALARARRGPASGQPSRALERQLRDQALTTLLMREAIEQEAADRGIEVSDAEVEKRWRSVAADQFKTKKALRRFLGGQTEQDVLDQLRLQTLSQRIDEQVVEQAGGGKQGAKALERFQKQFRKRWTEQTTCAGGYSAAGCAD